jgi:2,5-dihydroxypyridine 5,6-dioxygenase
MTSRLEWSSFVDLCVRQLELCAVRQGEKVAVVSQGEERLEYVDAFMVAARRLGATSYHVRLPDVSTSLLGDVGTWTPGDTPLAGNPGAVAALQQADLVIDVVFLLFSPEQFAIQEAGARILLCVEPVDVLERLFPTVDLRRRVEGSAERLASARSLRFTNGAGTDVTYRLGSFPVIAEYGYTDTPGRWDHWPSGFAFTGGDDDGVDGVVVVDRGDIIITPFKRYVEEPITITIQSGRIQDVRGGLDAELLRDYIDTFQDDDARGIAHIGWGCNERSRWSSLQSDRRGHGMESRSFYGNVLFSTGPNRELGGTNQTPCHIDIPMRNCDLFLDEEPILLGGDFVIDDLKVERQQILPSSTLAPTKRTPATDGRSRGQGQS